MNFNFDTGLIELVQTIDCSVVPPLGGTAGVLTINGDGALLLPQGATGARPTGVGGMFRWNTGTTLLEYFNGTTWETLSTSSGSVTSVDISTTSGPAVVVGGGPITNTGTLTVDVSASLQALSTLGSGGGTGVLVQTGVGTFTNRTIAGTAGNIGVTNGSGVSGNPTIDLVDAGTPVSDSFVKITTDAKGRVTATSAVAESDITALVDSVYVNVDGDTMTGDLTFTGGATVTGLPDPVADSDATPKSYVDQVAAGLSWKTSVKAGSTVDIDLATGGLLEVDGYQTVDGDRVLVKDQTLPEENGIYVVHAGSWVRSTDMDNTTPINEINGAAVFVELGDTQADTAWVQIDDVQDLGVDPVAFTQFAGMNTYTAGNGLTLVGNQFVLSSPVSVANGGTALSTAPTNGQLLIGNGTGYSLATITAGTAIGVTNGSGSITINNTGVTSAVAGTGINVSAATGAVTISNTGVLSITGTANEIDVDTSTGDVTLSLPATLIAPGSVEVTTTLTVDSLTPNGILYAGSGGLVSSSAAATDGQILIGDTGSTPVLATLTAGTGINITNGAGSITIANTGVTSVALSDGSSTPIYAISGSPVTTTGTLTFTLNTQAPNVVFAGPASGGSAQPGFRALVAADMPANAGLELYSENPVTPVAPSAVGDNAVAVGSNATATADGSFAVGDGSNAVVWGGKVFANGEFASAGDAQSGLYVLRGITTDNTATELFLDGAAATQRLVFPNNSVVTFDILVSARRTDATGGGAGYRFVGVSRKDTTAGSNTIIGAVSKTVIGETNMSWDVAVTADTTNGDLRVTVTGENGKTVRWVATVTTAEVTN